MALAGKDLRITCTDLATGESETMEIMNGQYIVVCGADRYVAHEQAHGNGTNVVTIKRTDLA